MILLALRLTLEVVLGCHCAAWTVTPHGYRCTVTLEPARCELVEQGWHLAAYGVPVCSKECGDA